MSIARSIPWVGERPRSCSSAATSRPSAAFLASTPSTSSSCPPCSRPSSSLHLLIVVKQKHTQPGYARKLAEPGRCSACRSGPIRRCWPAQLLMLMFGALFLLSALIAAASAAGFGPPGSATPEVKPEWYLMWIYGFLKIVPPQGVSRFLGATIGPNFLGGVLFPGLIFGLVTLCPGSTGRTARRAPVRVRGAAAAESAPAGQRRRCAGLLGTLFSPPSTTRSA